MAKLEDIEGIGPTHAANLSRAGVASVEALLAKGANADGRRDLAAQTGIPAGSILKWTNHADLMRIGGVGPEYAELLEAAGVDTVVELAQRNASNLTAALAATNEQRRLVRRVPSESEVTRWVDEAKGMKRVVTH
jgi:predicted flap endonuclease-1-like 5' DNA nuclease